MGTPLALRSPEQTKAPNGTYSLNFLAGFVTFFALLVTAVHPARATQTICDGIAGRPGTFIRILTTAPDAQPLDLERVVDSPVPINPFEISDHRLELHWGKVALNGILRFLEPKEWDIIRTLAREHLKQSVKDADAREQAKTITSLVVLNKKLFSFHAVDGENGRFATLNSKDGHTYFAHHDADKKIRVHDDSGELLWTSEKMKPYKTYPTSEPIPSVISLAEDEHGNKRLEYYTETMIKREFYLVIHSVDLTTKTESIISQIKTINATLQFVVHLTDGKRLFIRRNSHILPFYVETEDGKSQEFKGSPSPDHFVVQSDGSVYFKTIGSTSTLNRVKNGKFETLLDLDRSDNGGSFLVTRDGRAFADQNNSSSILGISANKKLKPINFPAATFAISSHIETSDGRILYARRPEFRSNPNQPIELYDLTSGKMPLGIASEEEIGRVGLELMDSSAGPTLFILTINGVEVRQVGKTEAVAITSVNLDLGAGESKILKGRNKAFVLESNQLGAAPDPSYTVVKIYGSEDEK